MAGNVHAVLVFEGERLIDHRYRVPEEQVAKVGLELQEKHGAAVRIEVDGVLLDKVLSALARPKTAAQVREAARGEYAGAELAHHLLWESYRRASQVQATMVTQMSQCAVEMNRRFVEQLEEMRGKYQSALERVDAMSFQQKMVEQESAFRQLSFHHQRMAEDERRAEERRRTQNQSVAEQIGSIIGVAARVISTIGGDGIDDRDNETPTH